MMRRRSDLPPTDPQPWSSLLPADSFYARLAQWRDVLARRRGLRPALEGFTQRQRPSIPPSMVVLAMLLQYHDDCSDAEAEQRICASTSDGSTLWDLGCRTRASMRRFCAASGVRVARPRA